MVDLPQCFHIICDIRGDPLAELPELSPNPPPFIPTGCYTCGQCNFIDKIHSVKFLWPAECNLMHHFMCIQNQGFAWDDTKHGSFCEDFFPPIEIPVMEHKPWN